MEEKWAKCLREFYEFSLGQLPYSFEEASLSRLGD